MNPWLLADASAVLLVLGIAIFLINHFGNSRYKLCKENFEYWLMLVGLVVFVLSALWAFIRR